jgi:5'-3' exonuclease
MTNSIYSLVKRFKPDQLVMALDIGGSWRKSADPLYKANREGGRDASPIDFDKFFPVMNDYRDSLATALTNVYFLGGPGLEADDIIGVLTKNLAGNEIIAVTTDRDMYQLYKYPGYRQWNPVTKKFVEVMNAKLYLDVKVLTGDPGDGVPQVMARMGVKTAEKWVDKLDELFEQYPGTKERYELNRLLIDFDMIPQEIQNAIMDIYKNYEFEPYSGRKVFEYFSRSGQASVMGYLQEFNGCLRDLKSYQQLV